MPGKRSTEGAGSSGNSAAGAPEGGEGKRSGAGAPPGADGKRSGVGAGGKRDDGSPGAGRGTAASAAGTIISAEGSKAGALGRAVLAGPPLVSAPLGSAAVPPSICGAGATSQLPACARRRRAPAACSRPDGCKVVHGRAARSLLQPVRGTLVGPRPVCSRAHLLRCRSQLRPQPAGERRPASWRLVC